MLGAIIGDIIGSPYEFSNTHDPRFPLFSSGCSFTDDSICTVAVADALLAGERLDFAPSLLRWCHLFPNPKGAYGGSFNRWLASPNPQPYFSWGNGAAMRVSPVAMVAHSEAECIRLAIATAQCTHNHPEGLVGAMVTALICWRLRLHAFRADALAECEQVMLRFYGSDWASHLPAPGFFDETCQGCVPLAFSLLRASSGFEDAIRRAVLYGGDSDTLGAIVGAMAEAAFGIPQPIADEALSRLPDSMQAVVLEFYKKFRYE